MTTTDYLWWVDCPVCGHPVLVHPDDAGTTVADDTTQLVALSNDECDNCIGLLDHEQEASYD